MKDLIIIGGGPGGYSAAIRGAERGLKVTLIEQDQLGGTCLNRGCIPTKALLHQAYLYTSVSKSPVFGGQPIPFHFERIIEVKDNVVEKVVGGIRALLAGNQVEVIRGKAFFTKRDTLLVERENQDKEEIQGKWIVVATGARSESDGVLKVDGKKIIGTEEALSLRTLPKSVVVIGSGRRGTEFAGFFSSFGAKVTLVERESQILPKLDREMSLRLRAIFTRQGIRVLTNSKVVDADSTGEFPILTIVGKKGNEKIQAEKILVPGTRKADLEGLHLEKAGVHTRDGFISVNPRFETSAKGVFAVGDVIGGQLSAHHALATGLALVDHLTGKRFSYEENQIPSCVYTNPEIASVGLTQEEAEKGHEVIVGKFPFAGSGLAVAISEEDGIVKFVVDRKYGEILGVHILGPRATELISAVLLAIKNELTIEMLGSMVLPHPSLSEAVEEAAWDLQNEAIHSLKNR